MHVGSRSNLALTMIRQHALGAFAVHGVAPTPADGHRVDLDRLHEVDRIDLVQPGPQVYGAQVLGYIFDQPGVLYPMPVGGVDRPGYEPPPESNEKVAPLPAEPPNPAPQPADVPMGGVLNLYA